MKIIPTISLGIVSIGYLIAGMVNGNTPMVLIGAIFGICTSFLIREIN